MNMIVSLETFSSKNVLVSMKQMEKVSKYFRNKKNNLEIVSVDDVRM